MTHSITLSVEQNLNELIGSTVNADKPANLYQRMARYVRASEPGPHIIMSADLYGVIATFWLVFFASIPAALPYLRIDDAWLALRISNGILICLLFMTSYRWARYTTLRPWRTGLALLFGGIAMGG